MQMSFLESRDWSAILEEVTESSAPTTNILL